MATLTQDYRPGLYYYFPTGLALLRCHLTHNPDALALHPDERLLSTDLLRIAVLGCGGISRWFLFCLAGRRFWTLDGLLFAHRFFLGLVIVNHNLLGRSGLGGSLGGTHLTAQVGQFGFLTAGQSGYTVSQFAANLLHRVEVVSDSLVFIAGAESAGGRSEERRVGKEC